MSDISVSATAMPDPGGASSAAPGAPAPASPPSDTGAVVGGETSAAPSGPLSFADALQRRHEAAEAPPEPATPAPATAEPGAEADPAQTAPTGPIPFERHKAALENARTKAREEVAAQIQQEYGEHIQLGQAFLADRVGTALAILQHLQSDPEAGPQLASQAARMLAARRGQQRAPSPQQSEPGPDLRGTDSEGREVAFYSAERQAERDAFLANRLLAQVRQEISPIQQEYRSAREQREAQQRETEGLARVKSQLDVWRQEPGFKDNEKEIREAQVQLVNQGMEPWAAVGVAYARVVRPKLHAQSTNKLVAEAARKSAGTTDNPAAVTPAQRGRPKTFAESFERLAGGVG